MIYSSNSGLIIFVMNKINNESLSK